MLGDRETVAHHQTVSGMTVNKLFKDKWLLVHDLVWGSALILWLFYVATTWPVGRIEYTLSEVLIQYSIFALLLGGLVGARWRFIQFRNLFTLLTTCGGAVLVGVLLLRSLSYVSSDFVTQFLGAYAIFFLVTLSLPNKKL